ncbi:hypothetical protein NYY93_22890, partial [Acinetobacter baumannii]|nr:hypothetical protein [Acinetobacter baumannii]
YPKSDTKHMPISGGHVDGSHGFPAFVAKKAGEGTKYGLTTAQAEEFAKFYGSNVDVLFDLAKKHKDEAKEYNMPLDVLIPLVYAMDYEMTAKPVDFFVRRRGAVFFNIHWVYEWKEAVINYMAAKLGWSKE